MRKNPLRYLSLARRVEALASAQVIGGREFRASTGVEFGKDGWVRCGYITPFYHGFSVRVVSAPTISVGLILWGWVKSALGVGKYSTAVLT